MTVGLQEKAMPPAPQVLDSAQLTRIESLHRGFLYQHLYAAACLVEAAGAGVTAVVVEHDEDLEVVFPNRRLYIQVKTRVGALNQSEIATSLSNFDELRRAHASGARTGTAAFLIVSNAAPGGALGRNLQKSTWREDVEVIWPGKPSRESVGLPPAWADVSQALTWCFERASTLPFTLLAPEVLIWKLTGHVLLAAAGSADHKDHTFHVAGLPDLFEQIVFELQDFPAVPAPYRPQTREPTLASDDRVRIVTGFSGAGKTAWASHVALHTPGRSAYFDVGDTPGSGVAASLARELVARLVPKPRVGQVLLPGLRSVDVLRLLERHLIEESCPAIVVLDNAHRVPADDLLAILDATSHLRFVLLGHPSQEIEMVRARLGIPLEELSGWDHQTIAAEASALGAQADYVTCDRVIELTGGLPLYVQSAISLAIAEYGGNIAALCKDLNDQTHLTTIAQEAILGRHVNSLTRPDQDLITALSVAACALARDEALALVGAVAEPMDARSFAHAIRRLSACGLVRVFGNQRVKIHDAVRVVGKARLATLGDGVAGNLHAAFKELLLASLRQGRDVTRFALLIHELGVIGDIDTLTDLASDEMFHEMGLLPDFIGVLDRAARDNSLAAQLRYWALDSIAFAQLHRGEHEGLKERLCAMALLVESGELGQREALAHRMKQMLFAAHEGRRKDVVRTVKELRAKLPAAPADRRLVNYNAALALYSVKAYSQAKKAVADLVVEYYAALNLDVDDVSHMSLKSIWALLEDTDDTRENLKRLADSLDLFAKTTNAMGADAGFARLHSVKFYSMAGAHRSTLRVGQDLVDEFFERGDRTGARLVFETVLLPTLRATKLVEWVVPIRAQYAVTLARCGQFLQADREMASLLPYEAGLAGAARRELQNQRALIEKVKANPHWRPTRE